LPTSFSFVYFIERKVKKFFSVPNIHQNTMIGLLRSCQFGERKLAWPFLTTERASAETFLPTVSSCEERPVAPQRENRRFAAISGR
jgi:hypothetical protein